MIGEFCDRDLSPEALLLGFFLRLVAWQRLLKSQEIAGLTQSA
jgi:hypothetical protein